MYLVTKILSVLLIFSFVFPQEPCDVQCLPDEVVEQLRIDILTLENNKESNEKIIKNLNEQIYMYIQNDSLNISLINNAEVVALSDPNEDSLNLSKDYNNLQYFEHFLL